MIVSECIGFIYIYCETNTSNHLLCSCKLGQAFSKECIPKNKSYFSSKTYVVGTQNKHLNEMVT